MSITDRFYTGVGSRKTPATICAKLTLVASILERRGFTLRSGGAKGADSAFEAGVKSAKQIFYHHEDICEEAFYIAKQIHPAWSACDDVAKRLHARNVYQVLGKDLQTPSDFVLCWTPDGSDGSFSSRVTGGTRTAIVLAYQRDIPVFNFAGLGKEKMELFRSILCDTIA